MTEETKRALRAMASYFDLDFKESEFWIKQYGLSKLTKTPAKLRKDDDNESSNSSASSDT